MRTILDVLGNNPHADLTSEIINVGRHGIHACEAGGPQAGLGCGGRGVARTIEYLDDTEFIEDGDYEVVVFDVLGDVVCGGFAAPLRSGFAEKLVIVVSEEPMAVFAANNIVRAVKTYERNGVVLAGIVANLRSREADLAPIQNFCDRIGTQILTVLHRERQIIEGERQQRTVVEFAPETEAAKALVELAEKLAAIDAKSVPSPVPMEDAVIFEFIRHWDAP